MNRILHIVICGAVSLIQVSCDRKSEGVSEGESRMEVPERIEPKASPTSAEARPSADPADLVRKILKSRHARPRVFPPFPALDHTLASSQRK
jgi:hypothetical protein